MRSEHRTDSEVLDDDELVIWLFIVLLAEFFLGVAATMR